jgi:valyl-tRNA synthetase
MHPFMPFVTEELFQRLGRRPGQEVDSIVVAKYPVENAAYNFPEAEKSFDTVFEVVKTIRSLAVQLKKKKDIVAYVQAPDQTTADLLRSESVTITALAKGLSDLNIVSGEAPAECESGSAGENVTVHVLK